MEQDENQEAGSDAEDEMYCELCKSKGRVRTAEGFCVDCVKYYCSNCLDNHSDFLPTHILKDKTSMPQDVCVKPCLNHEDEIIKFYCSKCDKFFCSLCKQADHTDCPSVSHLPALVQETDVARYLNELKEKIEKELRNIKKRENGINVKTPIPKECADKAKEALHSKKNEIFKWLDQHVASIEKEIEEIQTLDEQALQSEGAAMSAFKELGITVKYGLDSKNPSSKRCEMFMALKDYERQQKQVEERLKEERQHTVSRYEFKSSDNLKKLLEENIFGRQIIAKRQRNTKENKEYLGFFLKCNCYSPSKSWSCNAEAELIIVDQNDDDNYFSYKINHLFFDKEGNRGYSNFLPWDALLDPNKGFCKDDTIILQAHVIADPPQ